MDDEIEIIFDGSEVRDYWDYLKSVWSFFHNYWVISVELYCILLICPLVKNL